MWLSLTKRINQKIHYGGENTTDTDFPSKTRIDIGILANGRQIEVNDPFIAYLMRGKGLANNGPVEEGDMMLGDVLTFKAPEGVQLIIVTYNSETNLLRGGAMIIERAILAGGCFWGMQDLIRKLPGVESTRVGYTGGEVPNATYRNHGSHAEAIEIEFDNDVISYRDILAFFFQIHDPSTSDRQGNDRGASYRSEIYYTSDEQKAVAAQTIKDVDASGLWPAPAVTKLTEASDFWEAEPEHQDYLQRIPHGYTCHFPRPDWILPVRNS